MNIKTFHLLERYNIWATQQLAIALGNISDEDFYKDCGLFFKSIFGTLNHLIVGEHMLWFKRFNGEPTQTLPLNSIVINDRDTLIKIWVDKSYTWQDFINKLNIEKIDTMLKYQTTAGQIISLPFSETLLHVFNHSTHHRGQITAAMTQLGYACPEIDLIHMLIEEQL